MSKKVREFRSLIYKYFDSEADFAKEINWPRQRVNKITNGVKVPSIDELYVFSSPLKTSVGDLAQIFLINKSTNE